MKDKDTKMLEEAYDKVDHDWLEKIENPILVKIEKSGNIFDLMNAVAEGKVDPRAAAFAAESMISNKISGGPRHGW